MAFSPSRRNVEIMLKKIPRNITPELVKILMEMGHGDEIVLGDGNFPAANYAKRLVRCDGQGVAGLLDAILELFPLDTYTERPVILMEVAKGDDVQTPGIWGDYKKILQKHEPLASQIEYLGRYDFYNKAKEAYAIIATSESEVYANIILRKGIVSPGGE